MGDAIAQITTSLLLAGVSFVAGAIDAIAGGGGLLTVPALLFATGDLRLSLGTNKGQSVFGALASLTAYFRAGHVDRNRLLPSFIAALVGSFAGVRLVVALDPAKLRPVVLALLVFVAVFFVVRGRSESRARKGLAAARAHPIVFASAIGLLMGAYDGFFGPGVGSFLIALYAFVFGDDLRDATANAKVANFASNLGSVVTFLWLGLVRADLALPMAGGQLLGAVVGSRAAIKGGERLIRTVVLLVTVALSARLAWQMFDR